MQSFPITLPREAGMRKITLEVEGASLEDDELVGVEFLGGHFSIERPEHIGRQELKAFVFHALGANLDFISSLLKGNATMLATHIQEIPHKLGAATVPAAVHNAFGGIFTVDKIGTPWRPYSPSHLIAVTGVALGKTYQTIANEQQRAPGTIQSNAKAAHRRAGVLHDAGAVLIGHVTGQLNAPEAYPAEPAVETVSEDM